MSKRLRNVFFDLDGTLTDPAPGIVACMEHALRALGREPADDLRRCIGPPLRESFASLLGTSDRELVEEAMRLYRERFSDIGLYENSVYPGIPESLSALRDRGLVLHVVTSKPRVYADRIVDHFELRAFFGAVYGSELSGELSEKNELVAHALAAEQVDAASNCMVGDRRHDILGARANRVASLGVRWGYAAPDELEQAGADRIVDDVAKLAPTLVALV